MKRLGSLLTELGWVTGEQLDHALQMQEVLGGRLGTNLLELEAISEERLQTALSHQLGVPAARARDLRRVPPEVHELLPSSLAHRWKAVPFRMLGRELHVALLDVADLERVNELAFATGKEIRLYVANEARLTCSLEDHYLLPASPRIRQLVSRLDREEAEQAARHVDSLWAPRPRSRSEDRVGAEAGDEALSAPSETGSLPTEPARISTDGASADPPAPPRSKSELERWKDRMERLDDRDRIGRALLEVLSPHFRRVVLFKIARGVARGWLGAGPGVDTSALRRLKVDLDEPSVLFNLAHGASHHMGSMAPMPAHEKMASAWGGGLPGDCIVLAIRVGSRLASAVLCEPGFATVHGENRAITISDLGEISDSAGSAFARCILQRRDSAPGLHSSRASAITLDRSSRRLGR